jgi:HemX protein
MPISHFGICFVRNWDFSSGDMIDRQWIWIAAACYLAGVLIGTIALARNRKQPTGAIYLIVVGGFLLQTVGLYLRGLEVGGCPLGNTFELFQFTAWSATALYLVVGLTFRLSLLGYFTSLLSLVLTTVSLAIPGWDATRRVEIFGDNVWIEFHAALALFSYGVFALLALTSIMFLLRNYSLKHKRLNGAFAFLPAIRDLDVISLRLLTVGVVLLSASLLVGAAYWVRAFDTVNVSKLLITVGIWFAYGASLALRRQGRLHSTRLSWVCIGLFAAALLSVYPVNSSRHGDEAIVTTPHLEP